MKTQMVTIEVVFVCTASTLPNNADSDNNGDRDGSEMAMIETLGPIQGSDTCGGWEVTINWPDASGDETVEIRVYRFLNLVASRDYRITVSVTTGPGYIDVAFTGVDHQAGDIITGLTAINNNIILNPGTNGNASTFGLHFHRN